MSKIRERIFQAVLSVLGDKYDSSKEVAEHFYPINRLYGIELRKPLSGKETYLTKAEIKELRTKLVDSHIVEENFEKWYREYGYEWLSTISKQSCRKFYRGPIPYPYYENPLLTKVIQLSNAPRNSVFESFRRDSRLNGGKKRSSTQNRFNCTLAVQQYNKLKKHDPTIRLLVDELKKNQELVSNTLLKLQTKKFELFLRANNLNIEDMDQDLQNDLLLRFNKKSA